MTEENWTGSWCAQCGPNVLVDEDGCCSACGSQAVGDGAEAALAAAGERDALRERVDALTGAATVYRSALLGIAGYAAESATVIADEALKQGKRILEADEA